MSFQNDFESIRDKVDRGLITASQANVEIIRAQGVRIVIGRIPAQVRKSLNTAVKRGEIGHLKKDGYKPECYFHPNSKARAIEERRRRERRTLESLKTVFATEVL